MYLLYVVQLTESDHFEVTKCLEDLDEEQLIQLGGALGLHYSNLRGKVLLLEELVFDWLNQEDDVMLKSGKPSWESLMAALRTISQHGIVRKIQQQKGIK